MRSLGTSPSTSRLRDFGTKPADRRDDRLARTVPPAPSSRAPGAWRVADKSSGRSFMMSSGLLLGCVLACLCLLTGSARAQVVTEFSTGITGGAGPLGITKGPDGNLWFTEPNIDGIGRITPLGVVTEFFTGITAPALPIGITLGPDGALWFTELGTSQIARITTSGTVTEFIIDPDPNAIAGPWGITTGPDSNLWFAGTLDRIGRMTTAGVATVFPTTPTTAPSYITVGSDLNLWFTESGTDTIGRITTSGSVTEFTDGITFGANPQGITLGPDDNVWFTEAGIDGIGRITPAGVVTEFFAGITPGASPQGITLGPDGNLWFTEPGIDGIGRITPAGVVTEFLPGITPGALLGDITVGPDGNLWFTEQNANQIGRMTIPVTASAPVLMSAASRKLHGAAGTFSLPLSLADIHNPTTEPRMGPVQTIVLTFDKPITGAAATIGEGTATIGAHDVQRQRCRRRPHRRRQYAIRDGLAHRRHVVRWRDRRQRIGASRVPCRRRESEPRGGRFRRGPRQPASGATGDGGKFHEGRQRDRDADGCRQGHHERQRDQGAADAVDARLTLVSGG